MQVARALLTDLTVASTLTLAVASTLTLAVASTLTLAVALTLPVASASVLLADVGLVKSLRFNLRRCLENRISVICRRCR